jgi:hypothetical protein
MSAPELYGGIGSLVIGLLFVVFPKPIGVGFTRIGKSIWERHEKKCGDDLITKMRRETRKAFPAFSPDYDEAKAPKTFRLLGIVFLIQAAVFFILSAVM